MSSRAISCIARLLQTYILQGDQNWHKEWPVLGAKIGPATLILAAKLVWDNQFLAKFSAKINLAKPILGTNYGMTGQAS